MNRVLIGGGVAGVLLVAGLVWSRGQAVLPPAGPVVEAKKEPHTLRTTGTASVRIKPDAARVFFGVQTQSATVKEARTENNRRVHKIMEALVALKIPELKTKTSDVQVDILYGRNDGNTLPPITGYRVSTTFTVLVQDEDPAKLGGLAGRVLDAALESGAAECVHEIRGAQLVQHGNNAVASEVRGIAQRRTPVAVSDPGMLV